MSEPTRWPTAYSARHQHRANTGTDNNQPSLTRPEFADEADINWLLKQYLKGNTSPNFNPGTYADLPDDLDFMTAQLVVAQAQEAFMALPATLRERFNGDPGRLLAFLHDARNREEAIRLGLVEPKAPTASQSVPNPGSPETQTKPPSGG